MSRYRGPKLKITRRLGGLPGLTTKKSKKLNRPGKDGNSEDINKKLTEYGIRLEEKQKIKFNYGLTESQVYSKVYLISFLVVEVKLYQVFNVVWMI